MKLNQIRIVMFTFVALVISGCSSFSVTEQEMTHYLQDNVSFDQSVGIENVIYARVSVNDLKVNIGRTDAERVSVHANTIAQVQMLTNKSMKYDLQVEFSAIPEYHQDTGEIFLKSPRLEKIDDSSTVMTPEVQKLLKPAIAMIGYVLSKQPVYKLDSNSLQQALLKTTAPNLVIRDNKIMIEFY